MECSGVPCAISGSSRHGKGKETPFGRVRAPRGEAPVATQGDPLANAWVIRYGPSMNARATRYGPSPCFRMESMRKRFAYLKGNERKAESTQFRSLSRSRPRPPRAAQAEPAAPVAALRPPHVLQAGPATTSRHREPPFGVNPSASSRHSAPAATPSAASRPAPRRMPGRIIPACSSACSSAATRPAGIIPTRNPSAIIPTCNPSAVTSLVSPGLNARNRRLFRVFQPGDTFRVTALSEGRELQYNLVRWMTAYGYVAFKRTSPSFASRFSGMRARLRQAAQPPLAHPFRFLSPCVLMPPTPQPPLSSHPFVPFRPLPSTVRTLPLSARAPRRAPTLALSGTPKLRYSTTRDRDPTLRAPREHRAP